ELAPLMQAVPASFAFTGQDTGTLENLGFISLVDGRALAGPIGPGAAGTAALVEIKDEGESWDVIALTLSQNHDLRPARFGKIGSNFIVPGVEARIVYGTSMDAPLSHSQIRSDIHTGSSSSFRLRPT